MPSVAAVSRYVQDERAKQAKEKNATKQNKENDYDEQVTGIFQKQKSIRKLNCVL